MASFVMHEDQENLGRGIRGNKDITTVSAAPKRPVLGALDNQQNRNDRITKKILEPALKNKTEKQVFSKPSEKLFKQPAPIVPVAQFEAFKVYEDDDKIKTETVSPKTVEPSIEDDKDDIDIKLITQIDSPAPMSIEKSNNKENESLCAIVKSARCKDLFFEMSEYRNDIFSYLKEHELHSRPKAGYMKKQPDITYNMRTILVDWLVEVAEEYKLHTETLYLAVNYIDRFLSFMSVVRSKLQLVGTAAMFIASKYEEIYPPDVGEFVYITDDTYSKRQVTRMEILILKILDFDMSIPTPYTFITAICVQHRLQEKVLYLAMYFSELSLMEAEPLLETLPSIMAASSVALALHTVREAAWSAELTANTGYSLTDMRKSILFLDSMYEKAESLPQQAIQEKYRNVKYLHVSSLPRNETAITFD